MWHNIHNVQIKLNSNLLNSQKKKKKLVLKWKTNKQTNKMIDVNPSRTQIMELSKTTAKKAQTLQDNY